MQGGNNWILPKQLNTNRSCETLIGWKSRKPLMPLYVTEWREGAWLWILDEKE